ncbi:hypothetical protein ADIARSV_0759 [Arcticibacter svalbardensis MN12-7]|uniref:Uncharacterized protein n=2 Tax=Arcticibacter TaxID=1288026 RepID=R9GX95_9SPHI|nr:hypothetical protein ADIARSV_0759 [Arcticibacter svalbardensis MN12-7]
MGAELPPVSLNLKWMEIKPADTVGNWITKVANKTYESQSTPSSTSYKLLNENENVSTISALINEGNNAADAAYIKAALEAIGVFSGRSVKIKTWNNNAGFKSDAGLIFWLSDQPISRALIANLRPGTRLISYEPGKVIPIQSVIDLQTEGIGNDPVITLSKRIDAKNTPGQAIWTDGFGKPILSLESSGKIKHYHLYVKFNPQWTDLVWSEQFVKAIMPIVLSEQEETGSFGIEDHPRDQRVWNKNLQTTRYQPKSGTTAELTTTQPLNPGIWILALLVFITERILSLREKKEVKNA